MAKVKGKLGNDFCPQSLFLYGTKKDDGTPDFGLFCEPCNRKTASAC